MAFSVTGVHR